MNDEVEIVEDSGGRGRPSKFTEQTRARLIELVARGVPFTHAVAAVGISFQSFCNYRDQHPDFDADVQQAVALAIEKKLMVIEKAAELGDVRAACWYLERVHPNHFGRTRLEFVNGSQLPLAPLAVLELPAKGELAAGDAG